MWSTMMKRKRKVQIERNPVTEEKQRKLQELLARLNSDIEVLNDFALENGLERIEFLGSYIHFGTSFGGSYTVGPDGRMDYSQRVGEVFMPAAKGPIVNENYWSTSSFDCWPEEYQMIWMFGDDPSKWRKTDYQRDDDDPTR